MRSSVVATLVFVGLIGLGVRAQALSSKSDTGPLKARPAAPAEPKVILKVEGKFQTTSAAARQVALRRAQEQIALILQEKFPGTQYLPTLDYINHNLVRSSREEVVADLVGNGQARPVEPPDVTDDMRRWILEVEVTNDLLAQAEKFEREQQVGDRMAFLGRLVAVLVLLLGAVAAYIRAVEWTRGYYTGRLRVLAVGAVAAGTAAVIWLT